MLSRLVGPEAMAGRPGSTSWPRRDDERCTLRPHHQGTFDQAESATRNLRRTPRHHGSKREQPTMARDSFRPGGLRRGERNEDNGARKKGGVRWKPTEKVDFWPR